MPIARLGTCSWSLRPEDPLDLVGLVQRTGLDAIQVSLTPVVSDRDHWGDTISRLVEADIAMLSGMMAPVGEDYSTLETIETTGGVRPDSTWLANEAMARAMAVVAAQSGIDLVTLHAGFLPAQRDHPERDTLLGRIGTLADIFARQGVRLAFETGQESAETLLGVFEQLNHDSLGINFDPANMILYGSGDPIESLEMLAPHIVQVHIKDAVPAEVSGTWGTETPVGAGAVDWGAFFDRVAALPREVDAIIEREGGDRRIEEIRDAVAVVRRYWS